MLIGILRHAVGIIAIDGADSKDSIVLTRRHVRGIVNVRSVVSRVDYPLQRGL